MSFFSPFTIDFKFKAKIGYLKDYHYIDSKEVSFGAPKNKTPHKLTGSGSRGEPFASASPTTAPTFAGPDVALDEDNDGGAAREVAAAQSLLSGGGAGVAVAVVAMTLAAAAGVLS